MPLHRRIPKRGFHNLFRTEYTTVNIEQLERFAAGAAVDFQALQQQRLVRKKSALVKILGDGELSKALTVEADAFSSSARQKIEAAGGECRQRKLHQEQGDKSGNEQPAA
jgi:large subunit ribosomal protein L15